MDFADQTPTVSTLDEDVENIDEQKEELLPSAPEQSLRPNTFKQPVSKKRIAKKFLLAMLGVAVSSFIIYFGLTVYNKIRDGFVTTNEPVSSDNDGYLDTPESLSEAVKTFVDKTKWE